MASADIIEGVYSADTTCEINPGLPVREAFRWSRLKPDVMKRR
jgi:hypothetical protein